MNNLSPMKFTPQRILLFIALAVIMLFVASFVRGLMQGSLGLSGSMGVSAPTMFIASERDYAQRVEYSMKNDATGGVPYENDIAIMPPPIPGGDAPAGVSKIIKNADLTLHVENIDDTAQLIERVRIQYGGQAGNASFGRYTASRTGDITIWVPSDNFDKALRDIKNGAITVTNERVTVSDVSAQFVDLEARLKNARATESQYLEIMKRSGSIPDILSVTRELSQVRQTIEQLQGQLNYLSRQVALSSIHVTLTEEVAPTLSKDEWRPLSVIKAASRETLRDLTRFIDTLLVLLVKLPLLLIKFALWGGILYGLWRFGAFVYVRISASRLPEVKEKL